MGKFIFGLILGMYMGITHMGKFIFGLILGMYMGITLMCIIIVSREEKR